MSAEVETIALGTVAEVKGGKRLPKGSSLQQTPNTHPYLRIVDFVPGGINQTNLLYVPDSVYPTISRYVVEPEDVFISIVGTIGVVGIIPDNLKGANLTENAARIRITCDVYNPRFLMYFLMSPKGREQISSLTVGSTQPKLALFRIQEIQVPSIPIGDQLKIVNILNTLDRCIENLQSQNTTLEALAQTLFRSWFVNFDPVHAKAAGQTPEGMSPELAALFPSEFVESELGMIPKGWKVESLDEKIVYLNGLALQKFPAQGKSSDLPVLKIAQLRAGRTDPSILANVDSKPSYKIQDGDVIFSWSGTLEVLLWMGGECALNQHLFKVYSDSHPKWLCYLGTLHHLAEFRSVAESKQTTMGHIQRKHLSDAKICLPPAMSIEKMHEVFQPIIETIINNAVAARKLGEIRDELLPRLISGKLRIEEAEEAMSEVLGSTAEEEKAA